MPKLTHDQLQEWYAQLKTTLFDQVDIDLNSKEDLGSLHIIRINEWNFASPDSMPPVDDIYPLIPHRPLNPGEPSNDPLLTHYCYDPPAPDKSNMEEYLEWMWNNISTEPSDDQIQELYDMAEEGQLFVFDGAEHHQIQNNNGEISVTEQFSKLSKEGQIPKAPLEMKPPKDSPPEYPARPREVPDPGPEPRGFFAWFAYVGHRIGLTTSYSRYVERKDAFNAYTESLSTWANSCAKILSDWEQEANDPNRLERLKQETDAYNQYLSETADFLSNPLARFSIALGGISHRLEMKNDESLLEQSGQEAQFWAQKHRDTPHGAMLNALEDALDLEEHFGDTLAFTSQMFGPVYRNNADRYGDGGVLEKHDNVAPYSVPVSEKIPTISRSHAELICLSALADPVVLGTELEGGPLDNLSAQDRYQKVMDAFLLKSEPGSDYLFPFVANARKAGAEAMQDYAAGNPLKLATMLGACIRRQNDLTSDQVGSYALNSFAITAGLMNVLDAHPDLLKNCGLQPDELQQARANAAIYRMNEAGVTARANLLSHALRQKILDETQLRTAAADLLFMNTMNAQAANGQNIHKLMGNPAGAQMAKNILMKQESLDHLVKLDRKELGKAVMTPQTLFAKMGQLNPEAQKAPQEKAIEQPQLNQPQHGLAAHP